MAAQTLTPIFSGFLMEHVSYWTLFPYAVIFSLLSLCTMLFVKHGDAAGLKKRPSSGRFFATSGTAALCMTGSSLITKSPLLQGRIDDMVLAAKEGKKMSGEEIRIQESSVADLANIMSLWNNGEVIIMWISPGSGDHCGETQGMVALGNSKPNRCHYSIYHRELGYCGETFYNVDSWGRPPWT